MMTAMPTMARTKTRKRRQELKKDIVPQVVTKNLSDNVYTGIIRENAHGSQYLDGSAIYTWSSGIKYDGPFVNSHIEGKGKFSWPDGSTYEGELQNGKRHGEGVYVGADGVTTYEGQWLTGKRHGRGKLSYNKDGSSFYEGLWAHGMKHGDGHQVWASGNEYSGQWQKGTMLGRGRMIWRTAVGVEEYSGEWEDNQPHGNGTHIWHPLESKLSLSEIAPSVPVNDSRQVQRQLNNRYAGQFVLGKRNGTGTFYYANGSYYTGEWMEHAKNGRGRHVFEDGSIYEGLFVNDQMVGPSSAEKDPTPLYFAEDNPTCRCTDFSDLEPFALPPDCSGIPQSQCTGYTDNIKIFREIYNMLLRSYGDLKDLYSRYRVLLPLDGEDPYALALVEFWALASDVEIFTPVCSVARFNRMVFSGIRNHREVAPDDMQEIRPLTPRVAELNLPNVPRRYSLDSHNSETERQNLSRAGLGSRPGTQDTQGGRQRSEFSEEEDSISSSVLPSPGGAGTQSDKLRPASRQGASVQKQARIPDPPASARSEASFAESERPGASPAQQPSNPVQPVVVADVPPPSNPMPRPSTSDFVGTLPPDDEFVKVTHFRRPDGDRCRKTHDMARPLLQRQFLEAMVRVSLARFPHERGLEAQINRLFKELIALGMDKIPRSDGPFVCVAEPNIRKALDYFEPTLSRLFGGRCAFTQPEANPSTGGADAVVNSDGRPGSRGAIGDAASASAQSASSSTFVADTGNAANAKGGNVESTTTPAAGMRGFGDFAVGGRSSNVRARLDVTVRVKDVLKLLESIGLLCSTPVVALGEFGNAFGCALPPVGDFGGFSKLDGASLTKTLAPGALATRGSAAGLGETEVSGSHGATPAGANGGTPANTAAAGALNINTPVDVNKSREKYASNASTSADARRSSTDGNASATDGAVTVPTPPDLNVRASIEDFAQQDVRCNLADVLRIITGVLSPASVANIRMRMDPDDMTPSPDTVTLLEYLETELIYAEFERVLLCLADRALPFESRARLFPARVFEGFLQFVFLPALSSSYVPPPQAESARGATASDPQQGSNVGGGGGGEGAAAAEAAADDASAAAAASAVEDQVAESLEDVNAVLDLWHGFDGINTSALAERMQAPRTWPPGYETDVTTW
jgi:hypothetical protein